MSENAKKKGRLAIYAMAGVYLLFMARNLFRALPGSTGNEKTLMIVFIGIFGIIGTAMVVFGVVAGYRLLRKKDIQETFQTQEENKEKI